MEEFSICRNHTVHALSVDLKKKALSLSHSFKESIGKRLINLSGNELHGLIR